MLKFLFSNFKNYIKEAENILKEKQFDEETKNIILSLTYKLVEAYPDYKKVKVNVLEEDKFFNMFFSTIKNNIKKIELIKPKKLNLGEARKTFNKQELLNNEQYQGLNTTKKQSNTDTFLSSSKYNDDKTYNELLNKKEGKRYIVDEEKKIIIVYPSEMDMYAAILELTPRYFQISEEYIFKDTLERVLKEGAFLNYLEIFTDFKGYSWYQNNYDKFPYIKNLLFQNMLLLLGPDYIFSWQQRKNNTSDYIKEMEISLIKQYGKENSNKVIFCLYSVIYNYANQKEKINIKRLVNENKKRLEKMENHKDFLEDIKISKKRAIERIDNIDLVLNNDEYLIQAFEENQNNMRNATLSINQYIKKIKEEREELIKKIDFLDTLQKPTSYIEYKEELQRQINSFENNLKINEAVFELELAILRALEYKIVKYSDNTQTLKYLKLLRYLKYQHLDKDLRLKDIKQIQDRIKSIEKMLITNASKTGNIRMISYNIDLNYMIISKALETRILDLDDIEIELDYKPGKLGIRLYYKDIMELEDIVDISTDPLLAIKLRKKVKIFN